MDLGQLAPAQHILEAVILQSIEKFALATLEQLIARTPVRTGTMRRAWKITINRDAGTAIAAPMEEGSPQMPLFTVGDIISIINDVPYAVFVEFGTLAQQAEAIVGLTVLELEAIASDIGHALRP